MFYSKALAPDQREEVVFTQPSIIRIRGSCARNYGNQYQCLYSTWCHIAPEQPLFPYKHLKNPTIMKMDCGSYSFLPILSHSTLKRKTSWNACSSSSFSSGHWQWHAPHFLFPVKWNGNAFLLDLLVQKIIDACSLSLSLSRSLSL